MRLNIRREQIEVMDAVAEANFENRIIDHLLQDYSDSKVKLPDGGDFTVSTLPSETLRSLVEMAIAKARKYELTYESTIASFVVMMFDVAPNFDEHRLCGVLLGDEEKPPDERVKELPKVLTEKNWDAIREGYDPNAWVKPDPSESAKETETKETETAGSPAKKVADPMAKTIANKTMSRTIKRQTGTVEQQPNVPNAQPEIDEKTIIIDRKEL
jgi:hypothetical protein